MRRAAALKSSLKREGISWGNAMATLFRGIIRQNLGDAEGAAAAFDSAAADLRNVNMHVYAAVARRARGVLVGGQQGSALVSDAEREMADKGVKFPSAWRG